MILHELDVSNIRNLASLQVEFSDGLTLVLGRNAQGKTSLLEAVYLLATGSSHRAGRDEEWIRFGAPEAHARGTIERRSGTFSLEVRLRRGGRKVRRRNGKVFRPGEDVLGDFRAVLFAPEDLDLVKAGPQTRRRFFDVEVAQSDATYHQALETYGKALRQRNAALRAVPPRFDLADLYADSLIAAGLSVIEQRRMLIDRLRPHLHASLAAIAEGEDADLSYEPALRGEPCTGEGFAAALKASTAEERTKGYTVVGPHRDDITFLLAERPLKTYGSQGQQRTAAIAAKLAVLSYLTERYGERPILLLDDVLSELDSTRRAALAAVLGAGQTLVTSTEAFELPGRLVAGGTLVMEGGVLRA